MADVLVVDDDDVIRETLLELLEGNYQCQEASTAEEALRKLQAQSFDVVLTDISMPGLSGSELLQRTNSILIHPSLSCPVSAIRNRPTVSSTAVRSTTY
jgi:CheY-like chemotaxis protein